MAVFNPLAEVVEGDFRGRAALEVVCIMDRISPSGRWTIAKTGDQGPLAGLVRAVRDGAIKGNVNVSRKQLAWLWGASIAKYSNAEAMLPAWLRAEASTIEAWMKPSDADVMRRYRHRGVNRGEP